MLSKFLPSPRWNKTNKNGLFFVLVELIITTDKINARLKYRTRLGLRGRRRCGARGGARRGGEGRGREGDGMKRVEEATEPRATASGV